MEFTFISKNITQVESDISVLFIFEDEIETKDFQAMNDTLGGILSPLITSGEISGKLYSECLVHTFDKVASKRIMIIGLGQKKEFNGERLRAGAALAANKSVRIKAAQLSIAIPAEEIIAAVDAVEFITDGVVTGTYSYDVLKTTSNDKGELKLCKLILSGGASTDLAFALEKASVAAKRINFIRDLINAPANLITPTILAEAAQKIADEYDNTVLKVFELEEAVAMGMGAFYGVAKGSQEPAKFIDLRYSHPDAKKTIGLVGKGLTFDSGGISLKPADKMEEMKTDMSGGALVLGLIAAVAELQLPINVVAVIPATENMPSGIALKPGDVLKSLLGKTIEIISTDAEGRLILADALTYCERQGVDLIIDFATLTGACCVALGEITAGLMGNNQELVNGILNAANNAYEKIWQLPLFAEYKEQIKSNVADLKNTGGRYAGAITAGIFLQEFVQNTPWAHVDIAGVAYVETQRNYQPKGATGFGIRTMLNFIQQLIEKQA